MVVDGADVGVDTIRVDGVVGGTIAALDARSTVVDGGAGKDVVATVYTDDSKGTQSGSITLTGIGTGSLDSFDDLDATQGLEVEVNA